MGRAVETIEILNGRPPLPAALVDRGHWRRLRGEGRQQADACNARRSFARSVARLSPRCAGQPHIKTVIQHVIKHEPERPNDELRDNDDGKRYNPSPALKHGNSPISPIFEIIAPQGSRMPARRFPPAELSMGSGGRAAD